MPPKKKITLQDEPALNGPLPEEGCVKQLPSIEEVVVSMANHIIDAYSPTQFGDAIYIMRSVFNDHLRKMEESIDDRVAIWEQSVVNLKNS